MKHDFTRIVTGKGWTMSELAERWDIKPRQMNNIAQNPKQVHWDAVIALPNRHHDRINEIRANHGEEL